MKAAVAADIREVFNAPELPHAEAALERAVAKYQKTAPELADWMETNLPEGLTVFALPAAKRQRLRTSNMCEVLNRQLKRRTRVVGLFPNTASVLRLVTAQLVELSEEWETGKAYLSNTTEQQK
jgi:transposase-like protein